MARFEWRTAEHGSCVAYLVRDGTSERLYKGHDHPEIEYESLRLAAPREFRWSSGVLVLHARL